MPGNLSTHTLEMPRACLLLKKLRVGFIDSQVVCVIFILNCMVSSIFSLCLCVCMCSYVAPCLCMQVSMCLCACKEVRSQCFICSSVTFHLNFWDRVSHRTWSSRPRGSTCLCLSRTWIISTCCSAKAFVCMCVGGALRDDIQVLVLLSWTFCPSATSAFHSLILGPVNVHDVIYEFMCSLSPLT